MKFSYIALGLVAASAALADTVPLSGDCKKAFDDFEECGNTQASKVEEFVKVYQSEKCQNLYKDPIAALQKCSELDADTKDKLIADVKFSQAYNILYTAKTEDGKACPLYRNNKVDKVKDTCASKACIDASIEAYKLLAEGKKLNKNDVAVYEEILKGLQECSNGDAAATNQDAAANNSTVAANSTDANAAANNNGTQATTNANAETSDASIIKYTMALVFAAVYLFF